MIDDKINNYADQIRQAIKGAGTDEDALIRISVATTWKERLKIVEAYKTLFGRDMIKDLDSDVSGDFGKCLLALYVDPIELDADYIRNAVKGAGTNEDALIEIIASRPGWYMKKVSKKYEEKYKRNMETDIIGDTSGDFKRLLVSLIQGNRRTEENPDLQQCQAIAEELFKAGEDKIGTNEATFNKYIGSLSPAELVIVAREYHKISVKRDLYDAIGSEFSGSTKKLLQTIMYSLICPSEYFATRINEAIKGLGTDEKLLTRVIVTRHEIDMPIIKRYFKQLYGKDLIEKVKSDVSSYYGKLIIGLISK